MFYPDMKINNNQPSFKSRNLSIKDAQQVCRIVRKTFPYVSYAKAAREASSSILHRENIFNFIINKEQKLKEFREDRLFFKNPFKFYNEVIYTAIKGKIASCAELSYLTEMILKMNGIKKCVKVSLISESGKNLNHCVVCLSKSQDPKKLIILDPWLQDAGYLHEMITKYKNEYSKYLKKFNKNEKVHLLFAQDKLLSNDDIKNLASKYPQLIFDEKFFKNLK